MTRPIHDDPAPSIASAPRDTRLAYQALQFLLAVGAGCVAAALGLFFEPKIVIGLLFGCAFGVMIILRPVVGVIFFLCTVPVLQIFPPTFFGVSLLNPMNLVLAWISFAILLQRLLIHRTGLASRSFAWPVMAYVLVLIISMMLSVAYGHTELLGVAELVKAYLVGVFVYFLAANVIDDDRSLRRLLVASLVTIGLVALWGNWEYQSQLLAGRDPFRIRIAGRVGQPNDFGAFLASYTPFFVAFARMKNLRALWRWAAAGCAIACFFALLFTQSRGAYLGMMCAFSFVAFIINRRLLLVLVIAILSSPVWLPEQVSHRMETTVDSSADDERFDNSTEERLVFYRAGLEMFARSPIWGHGFGSFHTLVYKWGYADRRRVAHSLYIQMLAETGALGFSVLLTLFYYLGRKAWLLWRHTGDSVTRCFAEGYLGCLIALVVVNIFGIRFYNYISMSYFWAFTAILLRCVERERAAARARPEQDVVAAA